MNLEVVFMEALQPPGNLSIRGLKTQHPSKYCGIGFSDEFSGQKIMIDLVYRLDDGEIFAAAGEVIPF